MYSDDIIAGYLIAEAQHATDRAPKKIDNNFLSRSLKQVESHNARLGPRPEAGSSFDEAWYTNTKRKCTLASSAGFSADERYEHTFSKRKMELSAEQATMRSKGVNIIKAYLGQDDTPAGRAATKRYKPTGNMNRSYRPPAQRRQHANLRGWSDTESPVGDGGGTLECDTQEPTSQLSARRSPAREYAASPDSSRKHGSSPHLCEHDTSPIRMQPQLKSPLRKQDVSPQPQVKSPLGEHDASPQSQLKLPSGERAASPQSRLRSPSDEHAASPQLSLRFQSVERAASPVRTQSKSPLRVCAGSPQSRLRSPADGQAATQTPKSPLCEQGGSPLRAPQSSSPLRDRDSSPAFVESDSRSSLHVQDASPFQAGQPGSSLRRQDTSRSRGSARSLLTRSSAMGAANTRSTSRRMSLSRSPVSMCVHRLEAESDSGSFQSGDAPPRWRGGTTVIIKARSESSKSPSASSVFNPWGISLPASAHNLVVGTARSDSRISSRNLSPRCDRWEASPSNFSSGDRSSRSLSKKKRKKLKKEKKKAKKKMKKAKKREKKEKKRRTREEKQIGVVSRLNAFSDTDVSRAIERSEDSRRIAQSSPADSKRISRSRAKEPFQNDHVEDMLPCPREIALECASDKCALQRCDDDEQSPRAQGELNKLSESTEVDAGEKNSGKNKRKRQVHRLDMDELLQALNVVAAQRANEEQVASPIKITAPAEKRAEGSRSRSPLPIADPHFRRRRRLHRSNKFVQVKSPTMAKREWTDIRSPTHAPLQTSIKPFVLSKTRPGALSPDTDDQIEMEKVELEQPIGALSHQIEIEKVELEQPIGAWSPSVSESSTPKRRKKQKIQKRQLAEGKVKRRNSVSASESADPAKPRKCGMSKEKLESDVRARMVSISVTGSMEQKEVLTQEILEDTKVEKDTVVLEDAKMENKEQKEVLTQEVLEDAKVEKDTVVLGDAKMDKDTKINMEASHAGEIRPYGDQTSQSVPALEGLLCEEFVDAPEAIKEVIFSPCRRVPESMLDAPS